ncbi:MAG: hypothetical protein V4671_13125 [Armatimonadota bacterium]
MSVLPGGRVVCCDGDQCGATAPLPVALRLLLAGSPQAAEPASIAGWLFAGSPNNAMHFCPRCLSRYLPQALDGRLRLGAETLPAEIGDAR